MALSAGSEALLRAVGLLVAFADTTDLDTGSALVREVTEGLDEVELRSLVAALAGLASWSIGSLVPLAIPGQDPKEWIESYVPAALRIVDEAE